MGITVVPDIPANAGGVVVPILNGYRIHRHSAGRSADQVIYQPKSMMDDAFESVWSIAKRQ